MLFDWLFGPPRRDTLPTEQRVSSAVDCDAKQMCALFDEPVRVDLDAAEVLVLFNVERSGAGGTYQVMLNDRAQPAPAVRRSYGGYGPVVIQALVKLTYAAIPHRINVRVRAETEGAERVEHATLIVCPVRRFNE